MKSLAASVVQVPSDCVCWPPIIGLISSAIRSASSVDRRVSPTWWSRID